MESALKRGLGIALVSALLLGCGTSPAAKREKYLARGHALMEKKDYLRAILEFRNAARAMPNDAEAYYQIGIAYIATNDWRTGYAALRKAVELNPQHAQAQVRIAEILALTKDPEMMRDAESRLEKLLQEHPGGLDALNALAFTQLQLGKVESAVRSYEAVLAQYPGQLAASIMLARTKLAQRDEKSAEEILKKACADAPKSADARRILAEFYIDRNNLASAETALREALTLDSRNGPALLDLGQVLRSTGKKQEAEERFKDLRSVEGYQHLYGVFLLEEKRNEEAIQEFVRLANVDPDDRMARSRLVAVYRRLGRTKEAEGVLAEALKRNSKDADALLQRGEIALQSGRFGEAEVDLNRVAHLRPTAGEVHFLIAKLHQARGDKRLYRQELNESLRLNPALTPVRLELARDLISQNDAKSALDVLDAAPAGEKQSTAILEQRNWALWSAGNLTEMRRGIDLLLARGSSPEALLQDGAWKLRSGDRKGARAAAQLALNVSPEDIRALRVMNQSYLPQEGALALTKVREYAEQRPKSAAVQEFLGIMLLGSGRRTEARSALMAAKAADPKAVSVDLALIQLDVVENKIDDAHNRLQQIVTDQSDNLLARKWLGMVELMVGDQDRAIESFRQVAVRKTDDAAAANNLAYLLIERRGQLEEGLKYAQRAVELAPEHPAYCDTLGWALYRKGLYSEAVKYLQRTEGRGVEDPAWKYHLAMAYAKSGDLSRGRSILAAAVKRYPNAPEAKTAQEIFGAMK